MKKTLLLFLLIATYVGAMSQSIRWTKKAGSTLDDYACGIAADDRDNFYAAGGFNGTMNFDSAGFTKSISSAGSTDIYVAKFDCAQNLQWANRIGGTSTDGGYYTVIKVTYDGIGNIYVAGAFAGTATLTSQPGALSQTLSSSGDYDIFLSKYDTSGILQWAIKAGSANDDEALGVSIDRSGNVILHGLYTGTSVFGTVSGSTISKSGYGNIDGFIAKYTPAGIVQWVSNGGSAGGDLVGKIYIDEWNNIYAVGNFGCCGGGTATFGTRTVTNASNWGGYIAKADSNGNWIWVNGMGSSYQESGNGVVGDKAGNIYFVGDTKGNTTLTSSAPGVSLPITGIGDEDMVLAKYDTAGVLQWANVLGGTGYDVLYDLSLNEKGNLVLVGGFSGTASFNGASLTSAGNTDFFVVEMSTAGTAIRGVRGGGTTADLAFLVARSSSGMLYLCGRFTGTMTVGSTSLTSSGGTESFFTKLSPGLSYFLEGDKNYLGCFGDSITLKPQGELSGGSFAWLKSGALLPLQAGNSVTVGDTGLYQMMRYNNCGEVDTSVAFVVNITSVSAGVDTIVTMPGDSVLLTATGAISYTWSPATGLSNPNIANPKAKPSMTTQYIVTGTNGICTSTDTVVVVVLTSVCNACTDIVPSGLIGCYRLNNNTLDASGANNHGTGTNISYDNDRFSNPQMAGTFNGISSSVSIPTSTLAGLNTYTYSVWVKLSSLPSSGSLYTLLSIGSTAADQFLLISNVSGSLGFGYGSYFSTASVPDRYFSGSLPSINTWYHIALTRTATTLKFYVNGVLLDTRSTSSTSAAYGSSGITATIGSRFGAYTFTNGSLDNVRIYNRALSGSEITQVFNEITETKVLVGNDTMIVAGDSAQLHASGGISYSWSPATGLSNPGIANPKASPASTTSYVVTASNGVCTITDTVIVAVLTPVCNVCTDIVPTGLIGCYRLNSSTQDASGANNHGTGTNIGYDNDRFSNPQMAGTFNGASSSVTLPTTTLTGLNTYTYSVWVKLSALPSSGSLSTLLSVGSVAADQFIHISNVSGSLGFGYGSYYSTSSAPDAYFTGSLPSINTWYHIALTRTSTTLKFYVNGVLLDTRSTSNANAAYGSSGITATIGSRFGSYAYANGSLDNVRIYNRALSSSEITQVYNEAPETTILIGNDTTIIAGDSAQLHASGGTSYSWSPATGLSNPGIANPKAGPASTTSYIVTASNGSCTTIDTVIVTVVPITKYYSKSTGFLNQLSTWGSHTDGSGTAPLSFDSSGTTYFVVNNIAPTLGGDLLINGSNTTLVMGDGINTFNLTIPGGNTLKCDSIHVKPNINLTVQGALDVKGAWFADSSTAQYIGSTGQNMIRGSYYNVVVASSAKTITGNMQVRNNLTMFNNINCDTFTLTLGAGITMPGVLNRTSGTVIGKMQRWFAAAANSGVSGLFPIGTAGNYRPVQVEFTTAPTTGGTISASFVASNPGTVGLPLFDFTTSPTILIDKTGQEGYWRTLSGNALNGGTYTITCTASGFSGVTSFADLRLVKRAIGGAWALAGNAGAGTGTNASPVVSRTGVTGFGAEFAIGGDQSVNPLPVKWLSFTASYKGNGKIILNWATASEINSDLFEVERSSDGYSWETIGTKTAAGNASAVSNYSFIDRVNLSAKTIYYRIKQLDKNGAFTYSVVQAVRISLNNAIVLSPNPAGESVHLTGIDTRGTYEIFDMLGRAVLSGAVDKDGMIGLSQLSSGTYYIKVSSAAEVHTIKFQKQ